MVDSTEESAELLEEPENLAGFGLGDMRPPEGQEDFIKNQVCVFTKEDRSDPTDTKLYHSYHSLRFVLHEQIFFDKAVFTGGSWNQRVVTYQALYLTSPLWGFWPAPEIIHSTPPAGQFSVNGPDNVLRSEIWVMGILLGKRDEYPDFVPRQSPWFKLSDVSLYKG